MFWRTLFPGGEGQQTDSRKTPTRIIATRRIPTRIIATRIIANPENSQPGKFPNIWKIEIKLQKQIKSIANLYQN